MPSSAHASMVGGARCHDCCLPELIASLIVHPRPVRVDIDGLAYVLVLNPDGSAKVGCQDITAKGCEQAFRALAAHLGYDIEE
jgi:hypothetical protein